MIYCFLDFYYIFRIEFGPVLSLPYFKFIGDSVEATLTIEDLLKFFRSFLFILREKMRFFF